MLLCVRLASSGTGGITPPEEPLRPREKSSSLPRQALAASEDLSERMAKFLQQQRSAPPSPGLPAPAPRGATPPAVGLQGGLPPFSGDLALGSTGMAAVHHSKQVLREA